MYISKIRVKNFKSIKDTGYVQFSQGTFVLAGQNEAGKSSILEALETFEQKKINKENLNFEEENNNKNLKQEISCTYKIEDSDEFIDKLTNELIKISEVEEQIEILEKEKLKKIKEYTITRTFDFHPDEPRIYISLDKNTTGILKSSIKKYEKSEVDDEGRKTNEKIPFVDIDEKIVEISQSLLKISPRIVLFNDFRKLLPDSIKISDLENEIKASEGYDAVLNLEKQLNGETFISISKKGRLQKNSTTESQSGLISASFSNDWKQKIYDNNDIRIKFSIENDDSGQRELSFSIETKDNEFLEPRKRSKGMIWFLSLWLELKANQFGKSLVLLFDEPGLYLHIKANRDMLDLFNTLVKNGHQIIYSTHSPSLIDTSRLHNIGLVFKDKEEGTIVEGLTSAKINTDNKRDALQPIAEAMGFEPLKEFSILSEKNVILEGLSDFWYFSGMLKVLGKSVDYKFIPSIGIKGNNLYPLISFCAGYGLDWLLIMDNGENPQNTKKDLQERLFSNDQVETDKKLLLHKFKEIENIFCVDDLRIFVEKIRFKKNESRSPIGIMGKDNKIIYAKAFMLKVDRGEITKSNLSESTIKEFESIFQWIDNRFKKN